MSDEDEHEIEIVMPHPRGVYYTDDEAADKEQELATSWMDKAKDDGIINDDEIVTTRSMSAIMRCARRNKLIPEEMSFEDASFIFCWWFGFTSGYSFHQFQNQAMMAQALGGIANNMLENLGITQEEEDDGDESPSV